MIGRKRNDGVFAWGAGLAMACVALFPAIARAHPGHGATHGFANGFVHPLLGWDHLLAMVAVGIWAGQRGGRARWILPAAFVAAMAIGGVLARAGFALPGIEAGILASVLVLGALVAGAVRLPLAASAAVIAAFAILHGHAHGSEMPPGASGAAFGLGFSTATALLHGIGVAVPLLLQRLGGPSRLAWARLAGAAIGVAGLVLVLG